MPDLIDTASAVALLKQWGYGLVFLAMLLENAGLPLPGETITLLGGYAAGSGELHGLGVMSAAFAGAVLGDNIGYWVGRRLGWGLLLRVGRLLRQSPEQLDAWRTGFLRHAGKSVFLGRFVAVLRVLAGPMAGAVAMPYRRWWCCCRACWPGWRGGLWLRRMAALARAPDGAGRPRQQLYDLLRCDPAQWAVRGGSPRW